MAIYTFLVLILFHTQGSSGLVFDQYSLSLGYRQRRKTWKELWREWSSSALGRAGHFQLEIHNFWLVGRWTSYSCFLDREILVRRRPPHDFVNEIYGDTKKAGEGHLKRQDAKENLLVRGLWVAWVWRDHIDPDPRLSEKKKIVKLGEFLEKSHERRIEVRSSGSSSLRRFLTHLPGPIHSFIHITDTCKWVDLFFHSSDINSKSLLFQIF